MQLSWWSLNNWWRRWRTGWRGAREGTAQTGKPHVCEPKEKASVQKSFREGENLQALRARRGEGFHKGCDEF